MYMYNWTDVLVIGYFLSTVEVSNYEVAWRVTMLSLFVTIALATTLFPQISNWDSTGDYDKITESITQAIAFATFITLPALVGGGLLAGDILSLLFGPDYRVAATVLVILLAEKVVRSVHFVTHRALLGLDFSGLAARATLLTIVVNIGLNVLLVPVFGIEGAAVATFSAVVFNTLLVVWFINQKIRFVLPSGIIIRSTAATIGMGGVLFSVQQILPSTTVTVVSLLVLGVVSYGVITVLSSQLREEVLFPLLTVIGIDAR